MRIVLDSNVIIAAFASRGLCSEVFEVCLSGHNIVISEHILSEVKTNLIKKIRLPESIVKDIVGYLRDETERVKPREFDDSPCRDEDDNIIIGTALSGDAECIVTWDEDLLVLKTYSGIDIVTPREFWSRLKG